MIERRFNIVYESSVENLTEINSSFDKGVLRVAYTGKNRNKSFISKSTFEKCINTIYNCPIVCNYNRETDSIGAHDVDVVKTSKGIKIVNITQPVGVVPESSNYWWETIEEDNGEIHEYLCVEVIIWKRQEAYSKIKENGITDESMEITVKSGKTIDGYYHIDSFEFTAFCLLESAEPCYESSCIEMFSLGSFHEEYTKMMTDFKKCFSMVKTSKEDDINPPNTKEHLSKGGNISLDRMELLYEYGLTLEEIDFNIDEFTIDELKAKFEKLKKSNLKNDDDDQSNKSTDNDDGDNVDNETVTSESSIQNSNESEAQTDDGSDAGTFSLTGEQLVSGLIESLSSVRYTDPYWGEISKYMYVDYDAELSEVYCHDCEDWKLYGFNYSMNGDNVVVNFESKKRKKISIVDFDEGSTDFNYKYAFETFGKAIVATKDAELEHIKAEAEQKYNEASQTIDSLKKYQKLKMDEERENKEKELFARFSELDGIEAFEALRSNCSDFSIDEIENKCFEIKGRNANEKYSVKKSGSTRLAVEPNKYKDEPYGGLFIQYPPSIN